MVSLRDYEIYLLFLLLVKFHGSGECEVILPYKGFDNIFLPCAISSLDIERRPFVSERDFCQMISELQGGFQQLLYFKI